MKQYHDMIKHIFLKGTYKESRTGVDTLSIFGYQNRYNLQDGFPLLTTKKVHTPSIIHEMLWFLSGDTNIEYLKNNNVRIWNEWANEKGELGPVYGEQWRNWNNEDVDQIAEAVKLLKENPNSRRIIVSAWNPSVLPDTSISFEENISNNKAALASCHAFFQFYVADGKLSCQLYQRSADVFLGVPFNIASYALLTMMMAQQTDLEPGEFIHTFGDAHIYLGGEKTREGIKKFLPQFQDEIKTIIAREEQGENQSQAYLNLRDKLRKEVPNTFVQGGHLEQLLLQLSRDERELPTINIRKAKDIFSYKYEDFDIQGYNPHPGIKGRVAV